MRYIDLFVDLDHQGQTFPVVSDRGLDIATMFGFYSQVVHGLSESHDIANCAAEGKTFLAKRGGSLHIPVQRRARSGVNKGLTQPPGISRPPEVADGLLANGSRPSVVALLLAYNHEHVEGQSGVVVEAANPAQIEASLGKMLRRTEVALVEGGECGTAQRKR